MALIHCTECGHQVSENAEKCPNCGNPIGTIVVRDKSSGKTSIIIICLVALLAMAAAAIFFAYKAGKSSQDKTAEVKTDTVVVHDRQPAAKTTTSHSRVKDYHKPVVSGPRAYFIVISSTTSLSEATKKASSIGGLVVKGYAKGAMRYRVCTGAYSSNQEAQAYLYNVKMAYTDHAWVLPATTDAIVYQ